MKNNEKIEQVKAMQATMREIHNRTSVINTVLDRYRSELKRDNENADLYLIGMSSDVERIEAETAALVKRFNLLRGTQVA